MSVHPELQIVRLFDEFIEAEGKKIPVTQLEVVSLVRDEHIHVIAKELSKLKSGIFFVQFLESEKQSAISERDTIMMALYGVRPERPGLPTYSAGYQNGKQVYPQLKLDVRPSLDPLG